jgi:soluble lytic murein transglycosylase-like protein
MIAEDFVDEGVLASLPAQARSTLLVATRQFDRALAALEKVLADPATHPAVMLGPLTEYLIVAIRVERDYERPVATLQTFAQRKDLWPSLRKDVDAWIAALPSLQERAATASTLASARAIIEEGQARDEYGNGQGSLLHFIVASSILERYIDTHPVKNAELGEAYYLRGILETRIGGNYWVTAAPFFLEESIRIAPTSAAAVEALIVLERELFAAYEGSDIEELPEAERAHLAELRALVEGS